MTVAHARARSSEAASETRQRGRPAALPSSDDALGRVAMLCPSVGTGRGRLEWRYALHAARLLLATPPSSEAETRAQEWLVGRLPGALVGERNPNMVQLAQFGGIDPRGGAKVTVLAELGRIAVAQGWEPMHRLAAQLCAERPPAKEAARRLRRYRLGDATDRRALSESQAADALAGAVGALWERYPETSADALRAALRCVQDAIAQLGGAPGRSA